MCSVVINDIHICQVTTMLLAAVTVFIANYVENQKLLS